MQPQQDSKPSYEVMAPAGSYECLQAALNAGADSVYFGVEGLNMRSRSSYNFTLADLPQIVSRSRERGVRSYLTLNTIMYDSDLPLMQTILDQAAQAGVSAVIISDVAALEAARERGLEVHLSTQLNISNARSLKFFSRFADVAVLARELSLEQVRSIYDTIRREGIRGPGGKLMKLELFAHGALCMAVSGKCYLSLHEMNSSANRGSCMQICRRSYRVWDETADIEVSVQNPQIMSPKDLKTIHFLDRITAAGVEVFKIEGRARGPEYVDTVVRCYRQALDSLRDGTYTPERITEWEAQLATVFNRGFWNGYYLGQRLGEWTAQSGSVATKEKEYVAKVVKHFGKLGVAEAVIESGSLSVGDRILIIGPTTGVLDLTLSELRVELQSVPTARKGEHVSFPVPQKVRPSDRIYLFKDRTPK